MFSFQFYVDYSVKGTAKCQKCKKCIVKGELRIAKPAIYKKMEIKRYFHAECLFHSFSRSRTLENIITSNNQIEGFTLIKKEDQDHINQLILESRSIASKITIKNDKFKNKELNGSSVNSAQKNASNPLFDNDNQSKRKVISRKGCKNSTINIMYTNADQLTTSKKTELEFKISLEKPMIVAVCEVKNKNGNNRDIVEYEIEGFKLFHVNLANTSGRGIAVYIHNSMEKSVQHISSKLNFEESCLIEINLRSNDKMLFGCIYRSPTPSATSEENNKVLNQLLNHISTQKYSHICLVGDFNYKKINWKNMTTTESENSIEQKFIDCIQDNYLYQHVTKPTRIRGTDEPSLLDLVLTNEEYQVSDVRHHAPLGRSDHSVISFKFQCYIEKASTQTKYMYHKGDYESMRESLIQSNWSAQFVESIKEKNMNDAWLELKDKFLELRNKYVPVQQSGSNYWKTKNSVPIDKLTQDKIKEKHRLHTAWVRAQPLERDKLRLSYVRARNKTKTLLRKAKKSFEKDVATDAKKNPKKFWAYVRSKMKTRAGISPLLKNNDEPDSLCFLDKEKADILQDQFTSVFVSEPDGDIPRIDPRTQIILQDVEITQKMVTDEIKSINKNKSCGPDDIDITMLHELIDIMGTPITEILKKSLNSGTLPSDWLDAIVTPVFKKGNKHKAENYRPISLTCIVCKVLESIIKTAIVKHFLDNKLFSNKQHGFIGGRSTTTQLLKFIDDCLQAYALGGVIDTIYLDFAKAFDTVPHRRLIGKLAAYGISGNVLKWIEGFLHQRTQRVRVNGECSKSSGVKSGIPQGSVLGPILFVIYINDLPEEVKSNALLFADDTKIYRLIKSVADSAALQQDLNSLVDWSRRWLLAFNASKCHVLSLGKIENIDHAFYYAMDGTELEHVFEEKDLGVWVDHQLTFDEHISLKVKKANSMAGLIRRNFTYLDARSFKTLYVTLVRPHLEYCQPVWSPFLRKHINEIEKVQMRATKNIDGFGELTYEERLRRLDLPTLVHRRKRGDMIEVYKHARSYDKSALSPSMQFRERPSRKHNHQVMRRDAIDGLRGKLTNSFYYRTTATWNDLPKHIAESESLNSFKSRIDKYWKNDENRLQFNAKPYQHNNDMNSTE